ncbi:hypothetical protein LNI89_11630 [Tenacibaculum dicentrarchi]|uniref:hypothetical protein n=1 Tax=Tenacibaculum dicentrarchi TaxID=669041 RepID=UPI001BE6A40A|nr:hypothetical protein [Tenacibaculum dicentrarchi]MCD8421127.1 hypothetical protein [Tenacibaculum dicentrarchi]
MKNFKIVMLILIGIVTLIIAYIYYLSIQRDTKIWVEDIEVAKNMKISIELMASQRKYYGGHAFGWGGGDDTGYVKFKYKGIDYADDAPYTPIVIRYYNQEFYIVYWDRETDFNQITYKFFKSTKKGYFIAIERNKFPKQLAIQNRWFRNKLINKEILNDLEVERMGRSLTGKMWYFIETGINYSDSPFSISKDFIKDYKEKYITNREDEN